MRALLLLTLLPLVASAGRIEKIREARKAELAALVEKAGLTYPVDEVYVRGFKQERVLELWAGSRGKPLSLIKTYPFCAASGELGPKREEGDLQVPEGLYEVTEFNPGSNFHLSFKVGYPNASDRVRGTRGKLGGLIYVHGNCASVGCIAIEDGPIEEVYLLALDARIKPVRIDLFPFRLSEKALAAAKTDSHLEFWKELAPAWAGFEQTHRPAKFKVEAKTGAYVVSAPPKSP